MSTFQIKPFSYVTVYPTSWAGEMTFEQIYDDLAHYASNVMKRNGFCPHEIPECLQIGFMVLWETLTEQHDFLLQKTRRQAVFFILARCKISSIRYQAGMHDSLDALTSDDWHNTADEQIDGLQRQHGERWAGWATEIDMRIDIERIMHKLANKYMSSTKHLVALYYHTTQVGKEAAANIVTTDVWRWYQRYGLYVQQKLQYEFVEVFLETHTYPPPGLFEQPVKHPNHGRFTSPYHWREQYKHGNTPPAEALLEQHRHTKCISAALRAQLEGKTYRQAAIDNGYSSASFPKYMKRAARLLRDAYTA